VVLPNKGVTAKLKPVEKARFDRMLNSAEIGTLITALGTSIKDEFNKDKLRYHKIIIMTDADVDGSHIRTLLLTFFFRHMRELIDGGYLYIAQPPLYKMKRGQVEVYLKDERALEDKLIEIALEDATLKGSSASLPELAEKARRYSSSIKSLSNRLPEKFIEAAAFAGIFDKGSNAATAKALVEVLNKAKTAAEEYSAVADNDAVVLTREHRGVKETYVIDAKISHSHEAKELAKIAPELTALSGTVLTRKDVEIKITSPKTFYDSLLEFGRKGASIQRFKGLGEMNADQLWETTLDASNRTLLQVKINAFDEADLVFSTLMGDVVEPRRDFIQENALKVENLDV